MTSFSSAVNNLGLNYKATNTIQKETEDGKENTYIYSVESTELVKDSETDNGRCSEASVYVTVERSEVGDIIVEADSFEDAAEELNSKGFLYKDGEFTDGIVSNLYVELEKPSFKTLEGERLGLNNQKLEDGEQVFSIKLETDTSEDPLMAGFKIGDNSINFSLIETLDGPEAFITSIDTGSGFVGAASFDDNAYIYDIEDDFALVATLDDADDSVDGIGIQNNLVAIGTRGNVIYVYDIEDDFALVETLDDMQDDLSAVDFNSGIVITGGGDNNLYVYDVEDNFTLIHTLEDAESSITASSITKDFAASGSFDENVYVYDIEDGFTLIHTLEDAENTPRGLAFSGNGFLASGSNDDNVYIYDIEDDFALVETLNEADDQIWGVSFTEKFFFSGGRDEKVFVYEYDVIEPFFEVLIDSTNSPVVQGNTLEVDFTVNNTGDEDGEQDIDLEFESEGNIVDTVVDLFVAENESESGQLTYSVPSEQDPDEYDIWVKSENDSATDTVTVEVATGTISGSVTVLGDPLENAEIYIVDSETNEVIEKVSTNENGEFTSSGIEVGKTVHVTAQNPANESHSDESKPFIEIEET